MEQMILWFDLAAFTLMIASIGSTYIVYGRKGLPWLGYYMVYQFCYAIFLLLITYRYFSVVYAPLPSATLDTIVIFIRMAMDFLLLWIIPAYILALLPDTAKRRLRYICLGVSILIVLLIAISLLSENWFVSWLNKLSYNAYFGVLSFIGLHWMHKNGVKPAESIVRPFLVFSVVLYLILTILTFIQLFLPHAGSSYRMNMYIGGILCSAWGGGTLFLMTSQVLGREQNRQDAITDSFCRDYDITGREREIINLLLQGKSNKEIGDELFISHRTVDTHIYNIYRKCNVRNKLGLSNLVSGSR